MYKHAFLCYSCFALPRSFGPEPEAALDGAEATIRRKLDHLRICLDRQVETGDPLLDEVFLVPDALPALRLEDVDTSQTFLGKRLELPLVIAAMTGGCEEAAAINLALASAAARHGIAFGVGSQRAMIEDPGLTRTFQVRSEAPDVLLLGNIGITALKRYPLQAVHAAVRAIEADALCVHLNAAQELFQTEGERDFSDCAGRLSELCATSAYPVIAKEVGCGVDRACAERLKRCGVSAIDVGGAGGTNWILVDAVRSGRDPGPFQDWGIPTAASILEASAAGLPLIATGGIRNGLHMAKALALGADLCGIALPFLRILRRQGPDGVERYLADLKQQFRQALFLTGARTVGEFKAKRPLLGPKLRNWTERRGLP